MQPEKTKELLDRFPTLYSHPNFRQYDFCCGDGWFELLWKLSEKLVSLKPDLQATQVKNKFGSLRFYCVFGKETSSPEYHAIENAINEAERLSFQTCEICGQPGELDGMQVRCLEHASS